MFLIQHVLERMGKILVNDADVMKMRLRRSNRMSDAITRPLR